MLQIPQGLEDGVCALAKQERAIVSCPAAKARHAGPGSLVPPPPDGIDRVEFELQLLSMLQVLVSFYSHLHHRKTVSTVSIPSQQMMSKESINVVQDVEAS